jgi:hypothetical protein
MDDKDEDCERTGEKNESRTSGVTVAWVLETFPRLTLVPWLIFGVQIIFFLSHVAFPPCLSNGHPLRSLFMAMA